MICIVAQRGPWQDKLGTVKTLLIAVCCSALAHAHFALVHPPSALSNEDGGKGAPPCAEGPASRVITDARGGHPLAIRLTEFVFHPGHYRVALSVLSRSELPKDPDVVTNSGGSSVSAAIQNPPKMPVLADGLFAHTKPANGDLQASLTLPNLTCERCTLQIIEFMAEHGPNPGGGYYYHHCADLHITADPQLPPADAAWPRAVVESSSAFPMILNGGGFSTELTLANTGASSVPATVIFHDSDGTVRATVNAVTGANATAVVAVPFSDATSDAWNGWAEIRSAGVLGGYATFRSGGGEAVAALQAQFPGTVTFPYDNQGDFVTTLAILNPGPVRITVTVTGWDQSGGSLGDASVVLEPGTRVDVVVANQFPQAAGGKGQVRLSVSQGVAAQAVRGGPGGALVVLPSI